MLNRVGTSFKKKTVCTCNYPKMVFGFVTLVLIDFFLLLVYTLAVNKLKKLVGWLLHFSDSFFLLTFVYLIRVLLKFFNESLLMALRLA